MVTGLKAGRGEKVPNYLMELETLSNEKWLSKGR